MPVDCHLPSVQGEVRASVSGAVAVSEWLDACRRLFEDARIPPGARALLEDRDHHPLVTTGVVRDAARMLMERRAELRISRLAVVTPRDAAFGMARMFASLALRVGLPVGVFRDREEALAWLRAGPPPRPASGSAHAFG